MKIKSIIHIFLLSFFLLISCSEHFDGETSPKDIAAKNDYATLNGKTATVSEAEVFYFTTDSSAISRTNYMKLSFTLIDDKVAMDTAHVSLNISTDLINKSIKIEDTYKNNYSSYFYLDEYLSSEKGYVAFDNATGIVSVSKGYYNIYTIYINIIHGNKSIICSVTAVNDDEYNEEYEKKNNNEYYGSF